MKRLFFRAFFSLAMAPLVLCSPSGNADSVLVSPDFSAGGLSIPVKSIKEARSRTTVLQQYDYSCGSAAVATLLSYHYRHPVAESDVFKAMYAAGDQAKIRKEGFSLLDIKNYLDAIGYQADGVRASLDDLASAGIPAIVLIRENGYAHFVVVKGLRGPDVLVGDPSFGLKVFSRADFAKMWSNGILFVIRDRQEAGKEHFNLAGEWSAKPRFPLGMTVGRDSLANVTLLRPGRSDF